MRAVGCCCLGDETSDCITGRDVLSTCGMGLCFMWLVSQSVCDVTCNVLCAKM